MAEHGREVLLTPVTFYIMPCVQSSIVAVVDITAPAFDLLSYFCRVKEMYTHDKEYLEQLGEDVLVHPPVLLILTIRVLVYAPVVIRTSMVCPGYETRCRVPVQVCCCCHTKVLEPY